MAASVVSLAVESTLCKLAMYVRYMVHIYENELLTRGCIKQNTQKRTISNEDKK